MAGQPERPPQATDEQRLERIVDLLGGERVFRRRLRTPLDAHEQLLRGLPGRSLGYFLDNLRVLRWEGSVEKAIGMSLRTFQRRKDGGAKPLSNEQSGRTWKFAEILAKATSIFGSQEEAEQWLARPAMGLDGHRPLDLLATPAGVELVEDFLERLEYGVYT